MKKIYIAIIAVFIGLSQQTECRKIFIRNYTKNEVEVIPAISHFKDPKLTLKSGSRLVHRSLTGPEEFGLIFVTPYITDLKIQVNKGPAREKWSKLTCFAVGYKQARFEKNDDNYLIELRPSGKKSMRVHLHKAITHYFSNKELLTTNPDELGLIKFSDHVWVKKDEKIDISPAHCK